MYYIIYLGSKFHTKTGSKNLNVIGNIFWTEKGSVFGSLIWSKLRVKRGIKLGHNFGVSFGVKVGVKVGVKRGENHKLKQSPS